MKRIIMLLVAVLSVAALSATAALAQGGGSSLVFCLNDNTVRGGDDIVPFINWLDPEFGESLGPILVEQAAGGFRFFIKRDGGVGKFRFFYENGQPSSDFNYVTEGPCTAAIVSLDRTFWLCYSKSQTDPANYSRGRAIALYEAKYTVPFAVREPLSKTRLNSGLYLVCNLPAGYSVVAGTAVSTGGGELFTTPASLVSYMLTEMPLDYTRLAVRS